MKNTYNHIIDEIVKSPEMKEFLKMQELSENKIVNLINGSDLELFRKLILYHILKENKNAQKLFDETKKAIEELESPETNGFFYLSYACYNSDASCYVESGIAPFPTFKDIVTRVEKDNEWESEFPCYAIVEKWTFNEDCCLYDNTYTYYLIGTKAVYFSRNNYEKEFQLWEPAFKGYLSSECLSLPIPFKPGDIVTVDCSPFAVAEHALILNIEPKHPEKTFVLFPNENRDWYRFGRLIHGSGSQPSIPLLSPLYRLKSYDGKMMFTRNKSDLFEAIKNYVKKNDINGKELVDYILNQPGCFTEYIRIEMLEEYINSVSKCGVN